MTTTLTPVLDRAQRPNRFQSLVQYETVAEYREHFRERYCASYIETFDEIPVLFESADFDHAFFEDYSKRQFSRLRAERIDWIEWVLSSTSARLVCGLDSRREQLDWNRRVSLVDDYVVVVEFLPSECLRFVTAYIATSEKFARLRRLPRWR